MSKPPKKRERKNEPIDSSSDSSSSSDNSSNESSSNGSSNESSSNNESSNGSSSNGNPIDTLELIEVPQKRKHHSKYHYNPEPDRDEDSSVDTTEDSEDNDPIDDEDDDPIEDFTAPDLNEPEYEYFDSDTNSDHNDLWILLWIFKFQEKFRLPDVAIDSLIKFLKKALSDANQSRFEGFPTSSYMARKLLGIVKQEKTYAVCPDCNALYKVSDILPKDATDNLNRGFKCNHVEFLNHPRRSLRKPCDAEITKRVPVVNGYKRVPKMVFLYYY